MQNNKLILNNIIKLLTHFEQEGLDFTNVKSVLGMLPENEKFNLFELNKFTGFNGKLAYTQLKKKI